MINKGFRVRFHLGSGCNYKFFQVKNVLTGETTYHNPNEVQLLMIDCQLANNKSIATRIHNGSVKAVCAWVSCAWVEVVSKKTIPAGTQVIYNPRKEPNWHNQSGVDLDRHCYKQLLTVNNEIFIHWGVL